MVKYNNIAVAIDFSEQSLKAMEHAKKLAVDYEAALTLVAVVDTHSFGTVEAYDPKYANQLENEYKEQLQLLKDQISEERLQVNVAVEQGSAKKILTSLPNVDLIVTGATGKSKSQQMMLGSISQAIVRYSPYDVLIVR